MEQTSTKKVARKRKHAKAESTTTPSPQKNSTPKTPATPEIHIPVHHTADEIGPLNIFSSKESTDDISPLSVKIDDNESSVQKKRYLPSLPSFSVSPVVIGLIVLLVILFVGALTVTVSNVVHQNTIFPNIAISGVSVGGKTKDEATEMLSQKLFTFLENPITFTYKEKILTIPLEDIALKIEDENTIKAAWEYGRGITPGQLLDRFGLVIQSKSFDPIFTYDKDTLSEKILTFQKEIAEPPVNANLKYENGQLVILPEKAGTALLLDNILGEFEKHIGVLTNEPIPLQLEAEQPKVTTAEVTPLLPALTTLTAIEIVMNAQGKDYILVPEKIAESIDFIKEGNTILPIIKKNTMIEYFQIVYDQTKVEAVEGKFEWQGSGNVTAFSESKDGRELDRDQSLKLIQDKIKELFTTPSASRKFELPFIITQPVSKTGSLNDLGIKELIAEATTTFRGSPSERVFNIGLAAKKIHGALIPPGVTISFAELVGPVSGETGYKKTYVIEAGRTTKGYGGGLCQVSTTFYQVGLKAGLPVVSRKAHSYRVEYYEQGGLGIGYDATVSLPTVDLKFKNDTPAHILIQTDYHPEISTLTFRFYGTSDGRQVAIAKPKVIEWYPALPPEYIDTPALCPSTKTNQVDWAVKGAKVQGGRTITYADGTKKTEPMSTYFRPWSAKYERCPLDQQNGGGSTGEGTPQPGKTAVTSPIPIMTPKPAATS